MTPAHTFADTMTALRMGDREGRFSLRANVRDEEALVLVELRVPVLWARRAAREKSAFRVFAGREGRHVHLFRRKTSGRSVGGGWVQSAGGSTNHHQPHQRSAAIIRVTQRGAGVRAVHHRSNSNEPTVWEMGGGGGRGRRADSPGRACAARQDEPCGRGSGRSPPPSRRTPQPSCTSPRSVGRGCVWEAARHVSSDLVMRQPPRVALPTGRPARTTLRSRQTFCPPPSQSQPPCRYRQQNRKLTSSLLQLPPSQRSPLTCAVVSAVAETVGTRWRGKTRTARAIVGTS